MLAYVGADLADTGYNEQRVLGANVSGALLALPAGELALAAGVEYRKEDALDRPDPETVRGNTSGSAAGDRGRFRQS
ncbi:MAG: hypothetical protein U5O39_05400 [Gammaproteobacteria bacterium]|nr:hypothetical protein [Gammaproteobacteria bacterium]